MSNEIVKLSEEEFVFKAKHHIIDRFGPGKHEKPHSHNYRFIISLEGVIPQNGMVIDFADFKKIVNHNIIQKLENKDLNKRFAQPSAENISVWIWNNLVHKFPARITLKKVTVYEKPGSAVTYKGKKKMMESIWM